jgi:hypothetical protein
MKLIDLKIHNQVFNQFEDQVHEQVYNQVIIQIHDKVNVGLTNDNRE